MVHIPLSNLATPFEGGVPETGNETSPYSKLGKGKHHLSSNSCLGHGMGYVKKSSQEGSCFQAKRPGLDISSMIIFCVFLFQTFMASQPIPPPRNKALLRGYLPLVSLNKALLKPYFLGGTLRWGGG